MSDARCYVDLDSLLDTRYATIKKVAGTQGESIVKDWYHTRLVDRFGRSESVLTDASYQQAYQQRDEETLKLSTMTFVPTYMVNLISKYTSNLGKPLLSGMFKITVNIWPYDLAEDRVASLKSILLTYTGGVAEIDVVTIPSDKLTVSFIASQYDLCIMYDFNNWLMAHTEEFKTTVIPMVSFLTPKLHLITASEDELAKSVREQTSFDGVSVVLRGLLAVYFLDVRLFSYVTATHPSFKD